MQAYNPSLKDIEAVAPDDIWAIGSYSTCNNYLTLAEHWDGTQWNIVPGADVATYNNYPEGIGAVSSTDVWTVGYYGETLGNWRTLVERYSTSCPPQNCCTDVTASGSSTCSSANIYSYNYTVTNNCPTASSARTIIYLEVAFGQNGPWTCRTSTGYSTIIFQPGANTLSSAWSISGVGNYTWFRTRLIAREDNGCWTLDAPTEPRPVCGYTPTPTRTYTRTYTPTITPTGPPVNTPTGTSTSTSTTTPTHTGTATPPPPPTLTGTRTPTTTSTGTPVVNTPTETPVGTGTPCVFAFSDVHPTDYFYEAVRYLYCHGVVSGYGDGTFRPYTLTTRGQLTKIVALAEGWTIYTPTSPTFIDVPTNHTFYQYVETAYRQGIISGYVCGASCLEFRPGANVTRAQLCKIVVLAEGWASYTPPQPTFRDLPSTDPFYSYVETAYHYTILSGYSCGAGCLEFRPSSNATRGQICKIVYNAVGQADGGR